jgi:hypothetical protein
VGEIDATDMASCDPCERWPEPLARMQLWGIRWEPLQLQALGGAMRQARLAGVAAVEGGAIPDDDHGAGDLAPQVLQTRDHVIRLDGVILAVAGPLALWRPGADGGELIPGPPRAHDGGLPHRRRGPPHARQGITTGLLDDEETLSLLLRPLLRAGHVGSRQRAMAASSRGRARRLGCWGRQRSAWRSRPTWVGGDRTPNVTRITAATRWRVHTWPRKP